MDNVPAIQSTSIQSQLQVPANLATIEKESKNWKSNLPPPLSHMNLYEPEERTQSFPPLIKLL